MVERHDPGKEVSHYLDELLSDPESESTSEAVSHSSLQEHSSEKVVHASEPKIDSATSALLHEKDIVSADQVSNQSGGKLEPTSNFNDHLKKIPDDDKESSKAINARKRQEQTSNYKNTGLEQETPGLKPEQKQKLQKLLNQNVIDVDSQSFLDTESLNSSNAQESSQESHTALEDSRPAVTSQVQVEAPENESEEGESLTAIDDFSSIAHYLEWQENGRPLWAQSDFDALLFQVGGLNLAVPLIVLGHIHNINNDLNHIFGQKKWFLGLLNTPMGKIKTVDTALFVMPEKYDPAMAKDVEFVITIDGVQWGLAVKSVNQPVCLKPSDVNWRTERSKRPWLAGTVKSKMCALIDIPQMAKMLAEHEKTG